MSRNTTLVKLLDMYRAECRVSQNPAQNNQVRDTQVKMLQRMQEWLWDDFAWPLLRVDRFLELQAGQRFYSPPDDLDIDRITKVELYHNTAFVDMSPGIDPGHFTTYNSELDQREWPPQRWRIAEDEQIEIWPIPDRNFDPQTKEGWLKLTGIRRLRPLVHDTDRADLDDRMIAMYAAAEFLAASGAKDATLKLDQANKRYAKLRGGQMPRRKFRMFGAGQSERVQRVPIGVYNKPVR